MFGHDGRSMSRVQGTTRIRNHKAFAFDGFCNFSSMFLSTSLVATSVWEHVKNKKIGHEERDYLANRACPKKMRGHTRVPGLPIRDCAGSCNSWVTRRLMVSAIDLAAKTLFERLYLVPGLSPFEPGVNCPCASTPTVQSITISRFPCKFFPRSASHFLCQHHSRIIFWVPVPSSTRGQNFYTNREIVVGWTVGGVEAHRQLNQDTNLRNPRTKFIPKLYLRYG